jgi:hypothetical protein
MKIFSMWIVGALLMLTSIGNAQTYSPTYPTKLVFKNEPYELTISPSAVSATETLTLPASSAEGVFYNDGSGTLSWSAFTAADFDASGSNISIDYTNGQSASGSTKGFLTSADWTTFNNKLTTVANDATLTGDGTSGNPLGIDLTNGNSWSGTQTFTTVDINGGTIDGTSIGATTESTGRFTTAQATTALGGATTPGAGTYYRDNAAIAWGDIVGATGAVNAQFGNAAVARTGVGVYTVTLPNSPTAAATTVTLQAIGVATVTRAGAVLTINVFDMTSTAADIDFYYIVTGRP